MISIGKESMHQVLKHIRSLDSDRSLLGKYLKTLFIKIGDDASGSAFKRELIARINRNGFSIAPDLSEDDWADIADKLRSGPVYHAIAAKMSSDKRKQHFPEIAHQYEEKIDEVGAPAMSYGAGHQGGAPAGSGTTTANVAYYPVPMGSVAAGAKRKKKKKR